MRFVRRDYFDLYIGLKDDALRLQAAEYERRLQALNNEAGRINAVLANSVSREKYDDGLKSAADATAAALAAKDVEFSIIRAAVQANTDVLSRVKIIGGIAAPFLLLAGGVIARLIG